ncbi:MAG: hypothetical protein WB421_18860 [Terriglobales bacterium]|jgi:hypothetical protein
MAFSPKIPSLHVVPRAVPDEKHQPIALVPKPLKLDFTPNPNKYLVDGYGKKIKPQPHKRSPGINPTLRPVLSLSLLCDTRQMPEDEND